MQIIDAHLDLSYNALRGRNLLIPAQNQPEDDEGIPTVSLPDLQRGNVDLICATIFCSPSIDNKPGYHNAEEAHAEAQQQLQWYQTQEKEGRLHFVRTATDLPRGTGILPVSSSHDKLGISASSIEPQDARATKIVLLLEGSDALRTPADVEPFFNAGLRIVGLAWKRTRHAGGTGAPGPLTADGVDLVRELDRFGIIHDASHLAEESFWQLLDITTGPIIASHSNCRAIVPTDRQLSDDMIRAIADRGGVIGINFYDRFLIPPNEFGTRRATLNDVARHIQHICNITGNANHVGIGTDMDGGLGREQIPIEIETSADLSRAADALAQNGFNDSNIAKKIAGNWLRYFSQTLRSID